MDDAGLMRLGQPVGDLNGVLQGLRERQSLTRDTVGKRFAGDELHGNERDFPIGGNVVNGDDVGMVQRRRGFRLLSETADPFAVGGPARRQYLDGDKAVQVSVPRLVHDTHPAFAQLAGDGVMEQTLAQHNGAIIPRAEGTDTTRAICRCGASLRRFEGRN